MGLNTKLHLAVTAGKIAHCTQADALIDGIEAEYLLADRGYDTDQVLAAAREAGMKPGDTAESESEVAAEV